jgi:glycosyltransferase involved in cell wall biosynthesis
MRIRRAILDGNPADFQSADRHRAPTRGGLPLSSQRCFVSWTPHARATAIACALDAELFCPSPGSRKWAAPLRYVIQTVRTGIHVARTRPIDILFTNPPVVAGVVLIVIGRLFGARIWSDSHSGTFNNPRWMRFSRVNDWVMRRCAGVIVTNEPLAELVKAKRGRPFVLNLVSAGPLARVPSGRQTIVAPLSYWFDEPVRELLSAVNLVPEVHVTLTGRAPSWVVDLAPPNCTITGWLETEDYDRLLSGSAGVVCLTTREFTMQMGAFEALEYGLPILASGTEALRNYLSHGGVVFIDDHQPTTMAEALRRFWTQRERLTREAEAARDVMFVRARRELNNLKTAMTDRGQGGRDTRQQLSPVDVG